MAEEKKLSVAEVRRTIATSMAAAFGFVIALLWNNVVLGGLYIAGINTVQPKDVVGELVFAVTAIVITVVMIVLIIVMGRWAGKE